MPQLPIQPASGDLPESTGIPLRTQRAPTGDLPNVSPAAGQMVGQAITGLGQSALQATDLTLRTEAIKEQSRKAQNILDGKRQYQEFGLKADALFNQLQQGDYHTLPETFMEQSRQLMQSMGESLNPQARQLYEIDALQRIDVLQSRAFGEYTKRRDNDTAYSLQQDASQFSDRYVNADNDYERIVARTQLRQTYDRYVNAGLITGAKAEHDYQLTIKQADANRLQLLNRAAPEQMLEHYKAVQRGEPGLPGVPKPDKGQLVALIDDAEREYRESLELGHRSDVEAEKQQRKTQDTQESVYRGKLYELLNTNAPAEAYTVMRRDLMAARQRGDLSTQGEQELLGLATTMQHAVLQPKARDDDDATLTRFTFGIGSPTPQTPFPTTAEIQEAVTSGKLKPETGGRLLADRARLLDDSHYSKVYEVQQGKGMIRNKIMQVVDGMDAATNMEFMRGPAMQRWAEADRLYMDVLEYVQQQAPTPELKKEAVRRMAGPLSEQIQSAYALQLGEYEKSQLPRLLFGVEEVFEKEGHKKAAATVEAMWQTKALDEHTYNVMRQNLYRREQLNYLGGPPPEVQQVPEASNAIWKWIKDRLTTAPGGGAGAPAIGPGR